MLCSLPNILYLGMISIRIFTIIGFLEGISYLLLFFNMFIIKNISEHWYNNILFPLGITHGILFIVYGILAIILKFKFNWSVKKWFLVSLASLLPFGTFYSEKNWVHKEF